ncbi:MAG: two-component system response regulator CreB [Deltaproteobacteria bacterium]|nr:two-component system response regulator CreB [Deltaproteobacteria bacterium]
MSKKHILIIEDEPAIADNILLALTQEAFESYWAKTLQEAWDFLKKHQTHLILLDVGLPDGDGFSFCQKLRQHLETPVLFLTARSSEVDRVVGLEIGGDDYVTKPFSPRELVARVKAILRRSQEKPQKNSSTNHPTSLKLGPFILEESKRLCTYFDKSLSLSAHEFNLLKVFLKAPGRVFDREQLLSKAWTHPESVLDRTVDAHIKSLRAKLKEIAPQEEAILTHRGVGYAMRENW